LRALAEGAPDVEQPKGLVPPLGEAFLAAETPRQIEENVEALGASPTGSIALCIAMTNQSRGEPPRSLRSSEVVAGSTMSAWRVVAVCHGSWTMIVSGRRQARRSRFRSRW
jgi:hypothetical protein